MAIDYCFQFKIVDKVTGEVKQYMQTTFNDCTKQLTEEEYQEHFESFRKNIQNAFCDSDVVLPCSVSEYEENVNVDDGYELKISNDKDGYELKKFCKENSEKNK